MVQDKSRLVGNFVDEHFNNAEAISKVSCPTYLIHGLQDSMISWKHSQALFDIMGINWTKNNIDKSG